MHLFQKKRFLLFLSGSVCALLLLFLALALPGYLENRRFLSYSEELFRSEVTASTINLHYTLASPDSCGIREYPVTFGQGSLPDAEGYGLTLENQAASLAHFDDSRLSPANRLALLILKSSVQAQQSCPASLYLQEPLSPSLGIQAQLPVLLAEYTFRTKQDVVDYLALLETLPQYFSELLALEQEKSARGLFMNDRAADGIIRQCSAFISDPQNNYLLSIFEEKLARVPHLSAEESQACLSLHSKLIQSAVIPAYQSLIDGLEALKGSGKNENGLAYYPGGKSYYIYLLQTQVGTQDSVSVLENRLISQLTSDAAEMQALSAEYPGALAEVSSEDPGALSTQSAPDPEHILETLCTEMAGEFPAPAKISYEIKYVHEDLQEFLSPAFYLTPPVDTNSPNAIYINPHAGMDPTELFTTLAHEGFPGHLYQTIYFSETDPPLIRHLYEPGGYIEGWATYVESYAYRYASGYTGLSAEACRLLWLNRSMNLCIYSLMDVGIHYHGWTQDQTTSFLGQFGISDPDTVAEVFQYIVETPSNYLKYYYGYLNFLDLRDACRKQEGEAFDLRAFHQRLLELGPMPFSLLRAELL